MTKTRRTVKAGEGRFGIRRAESIADDSRAMLEAIMGRAYDLFDGRSGTAARKIEIGGA